ncbi:hypothetical protein Dimus_036621 [Dionaea muscipula]
MAATMRRALDKTLSLSTKYLLSRTLTTHISSTSATTNQSHHHSTPPSCTHDKSCFKTPAVLRSTLNTHQFQTNSSHKFNTQAENPVPTSLISRRGRGKSRKGRTLRRPLNLQPTLMI